MGQNDTSGGGRARPEWLPEEYDPEAPLAERLPLMANIEGGIELQATGEKGVVENLRQPQDFYESDRVQRLCCGVAFDNWEWEVIVPKKKGVDPILKKVNPNQDVEAYESTKRVWFDNVDVRIYGIDDHYLTDSEHDV